MNTTAVLSGVAAGEPEIELLLACVRAGDAVDRGHLATLLAGSLDWTRVVRAALLHGVSPQLAQTVGNSGSPHVPEEVRAALEVHLADNRDRNATLTAALFELLDALRRRGVVALPFKGQTLAVTLTGDPSLRRAGDLDFLVQRHDLDVTCETLVSLGYRDMNEIELGRPMSQVEHAGFLSYQCEYAFLRGGDGVLAEPHWAIAPTTLAVDLDTQGCWDRMRAVEIDGRSVPTLGLADLLIALCVHGTKHEWTRLQWIADLDGFVVRFPELDYDAILAQARSRGVARMLLLGLGLAHRILGTRLPRGIAAGLRADRSAERLVEECAGRLFRPDNETLPHSVVNRFMLQARERRRDRVAYVARTVLTPTEKHLRLCALPRSLARLYVLVKIAHDYVGLPAWRLWRRLRDGATETRAAAK